MSKGDIPLSSKGMTVERIVENDMGVRSVIFGLDPAIGAEAGQILR